MKTSKSTNKKSTARSASSRSMSGARKRAAGRAKPADQPATHVEQLELLELNRHTELPVIGPAVHESPSHDVVVMACRQDAVEPVVMSDKTVGDQAATRFEPLLVLIAMVFLITIRAII